MLPGRPPAALVSILSGRPITYYRPTGDPAIHNLIEHGFQAFNAGRLSEACKIFADKMLLPKNDTTIGLTIAGAMTPAGLGGCVNEMMQRGLIDFVISTGANLYHDLHYALNFTLRRGSPFLDDRDLYAAGVIRIYDVLFPATVLLETDSYIRDFLIRSGMNGPVSTSEFHYRLGQDLLARRPGCEDYSVVARAAKLGVPIYTSSPGDSSIGMNVAWHELMNGSSLMIDPNLDVNEVCAIILAGKKNGCVILGGGSPKNFYLQGQPTLWEVYGIPKGGNEFFIQITTDQVVWGGLSGATPSEAVSWGKVNPRRPAGYRRRVLRLDDRVPAVLRVRRRQQVRHAQAQGAVSQARGARRRPAPPGPTRLTRRGGRRAEGRGQRAKEGQTGNGNRKG